VKVHDFLKARFIDQVMIKELDFSLFPLQTCSKDTFLKLCKRIVLCDRLEEIDLRSSDFPTLDLNRFQLLLLAFGELKKLKTIRISELASLPQLEHLIRYTVKEPVRTYWPSDSRFEAVQYHDFPTVMALRKKSQVLFNFFARYVHRVDITNENEDTLLTSALQIPWVPFSSIRMLVEKGADVLHTNKHWQSPIILTEDLAIQRYLIEHGAGLSERFYGNRDLALFLLGSKSDPKVFSKTIIEMAYCSNGTWIFDESDLRKLSLKERLTIMYNFNPKKVSDSVRWALRDTIIPPRLSRSSPEHLAALFHVALNTISPSKLRNNSHKVQENNSLLSGIAIFQGLPPEVQLMIVSYIARAKRKPNDKEIESAQAEVDSFEKPLAAARKELVVQRSADKQNNPTPPTPPLLFSTRAQNDPTKTPDSFKMRQTNVVKKWQGP